MFHPALKEMYTVSITCNLYINLNVLHNCRWLQTLGPLQSKYIFCWVIPHVSTYWVINLLPLLRERLVVRDWWRQGFPICEVLLATTDGLWLSVRYKAAYGSHYFIIESICSRGEKGTWLDATVLTLVYGHSEGQAEQRGKGALGTLWTQSVSEF